MRVARIVSHRDYTDISYGTKAPSTQLKLIYFDLLGRKKIETFLVYGQGFCKKGAVLCLFEITSESRSMIKVEYITNNVELSVLSRRQRKQALKLMKLGDE